MTVAKGLTGGYLPLAATLTTEEIFDSFLGPVRVAADLLPRPHLHREPARLRRRHRLHAPLPRPADRRPGCPPRRRRWPGRSRRSPTTPTSARSASAGSWWASSWCATGPPRRSTPTSCAPATRSASRRGRRGAILRPLGNVVVLMPPLAMTGAQLGELAAHRRGDVDRRGGGAALMRGLFVTGTDTGVGKTEVACALVAGGARRGLDVGAMKPAQSGVEDGRADRRRPAARRGRRRRPGRAGLPVLASRRRWRRRWRRGSTGWRSRSARPPRRAAGRWPRATPALVVEGAGGLLVPLTDA